MIDEENRNHEYMALSNKRDAHERDREQQRRREKRRPTMAEIDRDLAALFGPKKMPETPDKM